MKNVDALNNTRQVKQRVTLDYFWTSGGEDAKFINHFRMSVDTLRTVGLWDNWVFSA